MTIQVVDLFRIIMYLCLSGFLIALIIFMTKLIGIVKTVNETFKDNKINIDSTLNEMPSIMSNVEGITNKTDNMLSDVSPDISSITGSINRSVQVVENTVTDVSSTVDFVTDTVSDTTSSFRYGSGTTTSSPSDMISNVLEIVTIIKSLF